MAVRLSLGATPPPAARAAPDRVVRAGGARRDRRPGRGAAGRCRSSPRCCRPTAPRRCSSSFSCRSCCSRPALSVATGLLFGLFPALHSTKPDLVSTIKAQAGQPSGARAAARFRTTLVTAQIALSMALLISAGLFVKSLMNVSRVNLGVKLDNLITFGVSPDLNGYDIARARTFFERIEEELAAVPGVTGVAASMVPLLAGSNWGSSVSVQGFESGPDTDTHANFNRISSGYFRTLGIPLMSGREFTAADARRRAEGRHRQRGVREEVQPRARRGRQAHVGRRPGARHGDRRRRPEREVQRGAAGAAAGLLHAVSAERPRRIAELLRPDLARSGTDASRPRPASSRGSIRTCRSRT